MREETTPVQNHQGLLVTLVATLGGFLFGFDSGVINGTVAGLQTAFNSQSVGTGFSVASMLLGCAVGAFVAGRLADSIGRRTVLTLAAVLFIISAWGSGVAGSSFEFVIYRIIGGLAVGAASVIAPAYISEIAPAENRGRLASLQQIAIITGLTAAFLSNYLLASVSGSALAPLWFGFETWRWMFWIEIGPALLFFFALFAIPRSPRFLMSIGEEVEAKASLIRLGLPVSTVETIRQSLADDHKPSLLDLMDKSTKRIRPIVWVGIGLAVFQQLVGINVIFYYGAVLWRSVGFSEADALLTNVITGGVSIGACILAFALVDRVGRKPLLLVGSAGMAVTLSIMALAFQLGRVDGEGLTVTFGAIALIAANLYVFFFNLSWGPVMWIMLAEMFPNQIRGSGLAVSGLFQWIANFAVTMTFPILLLQVGLGAAYGFYAAAAIVSILFTAKCVHETKGLSLEEMEG